MKWRNMPNYKGYIINKYGIILTNKRGSRHGSWETGEWRPKTLKEQRYLRVALSNKKGSKLKAVHRIVAKLWVPNPEGKPFVNHKDGNRYNNYYKNLEWVTSLENNHHAIRLGLRTGVKGEKSHLSKLTEKQVLEIRKLYGNKIKAKQLAKMYKVCFQMIYNIVKGRNWTHI